jgi:hypothetical protein
MIVPPRFGNEFSGAPVSPDLPRSDYQDASLPEPDGSLTFLHQQADVAESNGRQRAATGTPRLTPRRTPQIIEPSSIRYA